MGTAGHLAIVALTVVVMEGLAWAGHKYVMHGWGWGWHKSHHEPSTGVFELNDLYAVLFGGVAVALFIWVSPVWPPCFWIAVGITVYGVLYALLHDGLVHQRWPFRVRPRHPYLKRLVQAHRLHHAVEGRAGCVSFGFLYAPPVRALKRRLGTLHPFGPSRDPGE